MVIHIIPGFEMPESTYIAGRYFLDAWLQSGGLARFLIGIIAMILILDAVRQ